MPNKSYMLESLIGRLNHAKILKIYSFNAKTFIQKKNFYIEELLSFFPDDNTFIVRSDAENEDQKKLSGAGKFKSVLNVNKHELEYAIKEVIASYGNGFSKKNKVFIQPMLNNATLSGVLFTRCPKSGAPYYIINYNDTGDTTSVTSGKGKCYTHCIYHGAKFVDRDEFKKIILLSKELMDKLNDKFLDIEFSFNKLGELFLFQVRSISFKENFNYEFNLNKILFSIKEKFKHLCVRHPYLYGNKTILGVMPDWNPAEIIGIKPKPLSLSLYKEIITDGIWAYQRDNYGYLNLRSFPLLVDLCGIPYIDIRVSFNSFIPKKLPEDVAEKLVNYYLDKLSKEPNLHDKIEFDVVFSCYTFDLEDRLKSLNEYFFTRNDIKIIQESLREITNNIIHKKEGLWLKDIKKIHDLEARHKVILLNNEFDHLTKSYWLLEDCKRYGTLPFAGLARAGFIAVQLLNSMVKINILTEDDKLSFMNSLNSISTNLENDFRNLDKDKFIKKYGHLRPGTYDILSKRYDEAPNSYFNWKEIPAKGNAKKNEFKLSLSQMCKIESILNEHGLNHDVVGLFSFMKSAIEGREYAKFIFTKTLSDMLCLLKTYGVEHDISTEDMSFLDIKDLIKMYSSAYDTLEELKSSIQRGKEKYLVTENIILPPIINNIEQIENFEVLEETPNFITKNRITSRIVKDVDGDIDLKDAIIFIHSADPGYDWIFTRGIAGFVTAYGGVNSHMSIRAAEQNLPAIIGAGKYLYDKWSQASKLHIDCEYQRVEIIS